MTDTTIHLVFDGPFGLAGEHERILFQEPVCKLCGIYLFSVPYVHGGFLVTYVGETGTSFGQRMKEHIIQTIGGNYRISDPKRLCQGEDVIIWNGLWRKGTRERVGEYIELLPSLLSFIQESLHTMVVFTATLRGERWIRQRIEGALAGHIRNQPFPASSLLPTDIRYRLHKDQEATISVAIDCGMEVLGLPRDLQA
jgi:hypothetical protein